MRVRLRVAVAVGLLAFAFAKLRAASPRQRPRHTWVWPTTGRITQPYGCTGFYVGAAIRRLPPLPQGHRHRQQLRGRRSARRRRAWSRSSATTRTTHRVAGPGSSRSSTTTGSSAVRAHEAGSRFRCAQGRPGEGRPAHRLHGRDWHGHRRPPALRPAAVAARRSIQRTTSRTSCCSLARPEPASANERRSAATDCDRTSSFTGPPRPC